MTDSNTQPTFIEALWANEQIKSGIRTGLQTAATALAAKGIYDASMVPTIVGAIMWAIPTIWGLYVRRKAGLIATVDGLPGVQGVVVTPEIDRQTESKTVTTLAKMPDAIAAAKT